MCPTISRRVPCSVLSSAMDPDPNKSVDIRFVTRRMLRSPLRASYETVAIAVNKMLGAVWDQKLAFFLPLEMAQEYVPNLHLCKAHWTPKKGNTYVQARILAPSPVAERMPASGPTLRRASCSPRYDGGGDEEIRHEDIEDLI